MSIKVKIQWHGSRAKDLLNKIKSKNINLTKNTLIDSLYIELDYKDNYWDTKTLNDEEAAAISKLLVTAQGKAAQDEQSKIDVGKYIKVGEELGITDNRTLVYFADLYNQSPANAIKIVKAAGGGKGLSLDKIHKAALANGVMGKYKDRRNTTYNACKKIDSGTDKTKSPSDKTNTKPSPDKDNSKGKDNSKEDEIDEEIPYANMTKKEKEKVVFLKTESIIKPKPKHPRIWLE
ncbi:MAG: putative peptidoglycan binding domain protein [Eubacterium sp.]|nr:putative peptidoglycan binding domain protein [Eubacterium sp.]